MATIDRNSKPDTIVLSLPAGAGAAALADDVSQYRTDLANATTYVHESPSARAAITYPREVSLVVEVDDTDEATLIEHGDGLGNFTFNVTVSGGFVRCGENGSTVVSETLPGVDGTVRRFLIAWSTRLEAGTTVRSELLLVNLGDESVVYATATHSAGTTSAAYNLMINADSSGAGGLADITRWRAARVGRRFHSTTEAWEDWVGETTPPSTTQVRRGAPLVPDRATLDIGDDGSFAGPAHLWSGATFRDCDRRLVGPLVNVRIASPYVIDTTYSPTAWHRLAPGSSTLRISTALAFYSPIPGKVSRARVRLFVRQSCDVDTVTAEVRYRVYSIAGLLNGEPITYQRTAQATCTTDHGATGGEWLDLGVLRFARDSIDCTLFAVAFEIDPDDPLAGDTQAFVHAITIEPYAEEADDDDLPFNLAP